MENGSDILNMAEVKRIAAVHGIDLQSGLTEDSAMLLNYALMDSGFFPEGTTVSIRWNRETNAGVLTITPPVVLTSSDSDIRTDQVADAIRAWADEFSPSSLSHNDRGEKVFNSNGEEIGFGEIYYTRMYHQTDDPNNPSYQPYFLLNQSYSYPLTGGEPISDTLTHLEETIPQDEWIHRRLDTYYNSDSVDSWHEESLLDLSHTGALSDNLTEKTDIFTELSLSSMDEAREHVGDLTGTTGDYFYGTGTSFFRNRDGNFVNVGTSDTATYNGNLSPQENVTHYAAGVAAEIKDRIARSLGYSDETLTVEYDYNTNKVTIRSKYLPAEGIVLDEYGVNPEHIIDASYQHALSETDNNPNYREFHFLLSINDSNDYTHAISYDFVRNPDGTLKRDADGNFFITVDDFTVKITEEEFNNPDGKEITRKIRNVISAEDIFHKNDMEIALHDLNGEYVYRIVDDTGVKLFREEGNKFYEIDQNGNKTGNVYSSLDECTHANDSLEHKKGGYNARLSRNKNRSISIADEELYKTFNDNMKSSSSDLDAINPEITKAGSKLIKYSPNVDGIISSACDNNIRIMNDIDLLGQLITHVVDLYKICDTDMKAVLDNILFGGENNNGSFADYVFKMKENISSAKKYTEEEFRKEFNEIYSKFVSDMKEKVYTDIALLDDGNLIIDKKTFESMSSSLPFEVRSCFELKGNKYYIKLDSMYSLYGEAFDQFEDNPDPKKWASIFAEKSGLPVDVAQKLVIDPFVETIGFALNYDSYASFVDQYQRLESFQPYVDYIFEDEYLSILQAVTDEGEYNGKKLSDTYLSPAEFAMVAYLQDYHYADAKDVRYLETLEDELHDREGKEKATKHMLHMIENGIDGSDYWSQFFNGVGDGVRKLPKGFIRGSLGLLEGSLLNPTVDEYACGYVGEFISNNYDLSEVVAMYRNGEISDSEYELLTKLTGNKQVKGSRKITNEEKAALNGAYGIGDTVGDMATNIVLDTAISAIPGFGPAAVSLLKATIKGIAKSGDTLYETKQGSILNQPDVLYSYFKGAVKFGTVLATDAISSKIDGKDFNLREPVTSTPSTPNSFGDITGNPKGEFDFREWFGEHFTASFNFKMPIKDAFGEEGAAGLQKIGVGYLLDQGEKIAGNFYYDFFIANEQDEYVPLFKFDELFNDFQDATIGINFSAIEKCLGSETPCEDTTAFITKKLLKFGKPKFKFHY